ncbi:hypothetical protein GW17_00009102 [Ensete ventricosum]|nr:hypothetical protein GW17_00009102 [Ensete ventricosum]
MLNLCASLLLYDVNLGPGLFFKMVGQVIWCLAHTLWIGNTVAVAASVGLIAHHIYGVWNGDRRLALRYGEAFEVLKSRTSVIPFAAILDGRQKHSVFDFFGDASL